MKRPYLSKTSGPAAAQAVARRLAPLTAMLEIADRCNEVCVHCYQIQGQKGELSTAQIFELLDELAQAGILFLVLSGGEPTLRRDFLQIVERAREHRFAVKVYTNGLSMTPELARSLRELAVQEVQISLYSNRPEVHDSVTKVPGSWEQTVRGVRLLIEEGVPVVVKTPLMSVNQDHHQEYIDFVSSLGADYTLDPSGLFAREDGSREPQKFDADPSFLPAVLDNPDLSPEGAVQRHETPLAAKPCGACTTILHVEANGEVRPCAMWDVPCGNAASDGLSEALLDENAEAIRGLTWADIQGCRVCDLRHYCHRCYAQSRTESGDALKPYPSACARASDTFAHVEGRRPIIDGVDRGNPGVGPYRELAFGRYSTVEDDWTERDAELRRRHRWLQSGRELVPAKRLIRGKKNDSVRPVGLATESVEGA